MPDDKIIPATVQTALGAPAGGDLLSRPQAAELAGVSESSWRRHVEYQIIEPIRDARGRYYFTRESVLAAREKIAAHLRKLHKRNDAGTSPTIDRETYVRVLAALDAGKHAPDIALELALYIPEVESVQRDWARHRGALFVDATALAEVRKFVLERDRHRPVELANGDDFVTFVCNLIKDADLEEEQRRCHFCPWGIIHRATFCPTCAETKFASKKKR